MSAFDCFGCALSFCRAHSQPQTVDIFLSHAISIVVVEVGRVHTRSQFPVVVVSPLWPGSTVAR